MEKSGRLYVVATPIGNLEDITLRAIRVLKEADLIAAEDTRRTKKLLLHYAIDTPLTSCFEHNEKDKTPLLIERLKAGVNIALVSDAGTPGISDPGYRLIGAAIQAAVPVVSIPGPSAVMTLLSVAGLPIDEFTFKGFVPSGDAQRRGFLRALKAGEHTYVMYDSPNRIVDTLEAVAETMGNAAVAVGREMTKMYEEVLRGDAAEVAAILKGRDSVKGEITLIVRTRFLEDKSERAAIAEIENLIKAGYALKDIAKAVSEQFDMPRRDAYRKALEIREGLRDADTAE